MRPSYLDLPREVLRETVIAVPMPKTTDETHIETRHGTELPPQDNDHVALGAEPFPLPTELQETEDAAQSATDPEVPAT